MAYEFVIQKTHLVDLQAAHFGVSPEHFLSSSPDIGMQAIEIAHSGLVIAHPQARGRRQDMTPARLFINAYDETPSSSDTESVARGEDIIARIPEQVEEFCKARNIPAIAAARVGVKILGFAFENGVGLNSHLDVYANRTQQKKGKLESTLSFSVSPINMILMHRKSTMRTKIRKPFSR